MTSTQDSLMSGRHEAAGALAANELFQQNGWTNGLPVVPRQHMGWSRKPVTRPLPAPTSWQMNCRVQGYG